MAETLTIRTASSTEVVKIAVPGPQGATGAGVPTGGSTGQVLRKASGSDYDTEWAAAGAGSGSVTSVALASSDLTITGSPITSSGTITANIAANAVTLEKLQTISSQHLLGRHGNGNGGVQQVGLGTGLAISGSNVRVATTGITAGTYTKLTVDETGRATVGETATPSDIGAQSIFTAVNIDNVLNPSPYQITANRAQSVSVRTTNDYTIRLPETGHQNGDIVDVKAESLSATKTITIERGVGSSSWTTIGTINVQGGRFRFIANGTGRSNWYQDTYFTTDGTIGAPASHTHTPSEVGLGNVSNTAQVTSVSGTAPIVSSGGTTPTISVTVGTGANTVAAGDDSRITGAAQKSANLSDLASASTARTNLGLGTAAVEAASSFAQASHTHTASAISDSTTAGRALLTAADAAAQRTSLGLAAIAASGSASDLTTGTVGTARLGTGTADNTTFLRGDGTWSAAGVSDGDKGDITVSNSGATWTIDANAVTNADLAQVATATIKGRATAGTGNVEDLSATQARGVLALATTDNVTFASLATSPAANTSALTTTGYSLTGSNAQSLVDLAGTWNTTGTPSAFKLNITDTASNASSLLMQLQTGGTNRFTVSKGGAVVCASSLTASALAISSADFVNNGFPVFRALGTEILAYTTNPSTHVSLRVDYSYGFNNGSPTGGATDVRMWRDAAATWALRDGVNAQEMRCYGTYTSSTNYQRMTIKSVKQTLSALSGASATTTGTFIPDGAVVVGVTTRVATALTGASGYTIGDGTDADRWGDITGTAIGTTSDNRDWTAGTIECFTAGGNITLTAKTSNFTAGAIEVCVFYLAGEAD